MIGLESLTISTGAGTSLTFPVKTPSMKDSYIIKSVDGLDPPPIDVKLQKTLYSGSHNLGNRPNERQIVMALRFNPNYAAGETVEKLRDKLYLFLNEGYDRYLTVTLNGRRSVSTIGFVTNFENAVYAKEPIVQLTIDCISAYLVDNDITAVKMAYNPSGKQYEYSNPTPGIAATGFYFSAPILDPAKLNGVIGINGDRVLTIRPIGGLGITTSHNLVFNTNPGSRYIKALNPTAETEINLLEYIGGSWPRISDRGIPKSLTISASMYDIATIIGQPTITYRNLYWGI